MPHPAFVIYLENAMSDANVSQFLPSTERWTLGAGRALTLQARETGVLRIKQGRVWATFDLAGQDSSVRGGDYFVSRGESLCLAGGETVVLEAYGEQGGAAAGFSWEPAPGAAGMPVFPAAGWRAAVARSAAELRLGLGLVLRALTLTRMPVRR